MNMGEQKTISALVVGGEASAGPPLGPALGPLGVNVMSIVKEMNDITKDYAGMRVPVKITVDTETKAFTVDVGIPTASALIVKESQIEKGSGSPKLEQNGNLTVSQLMKIAKTKLSQSYGMDAKSVAREVAGSCVSMGVKIEEKPPKEFLKELLDGKWDRVMSEAKVEEKVEAKVEEKVEAKVEEKVEAN
jgi:large subunit ribosomal protein L11